MEKKTSSVERVTTALNELNISTQVKELPQSTKTAAEAAIAVGSQVGQIVKSLLFQTRHTKKPLLILTSGANQVNEQVVGDIIGEEIKFASASYVREQTRSSLLSMRIYYLIKLSGQQLDLTMLYSALILRYWYLQPMGGLSL